MVLDNIQILSNNITNLDYCNKINLIDTQLTLLNISLDSKSFTNQTYVTSTGAQKVKFQNFNLTNCNLGIFSIFSQQSHTILELTKLNILGNKYLPSANQNQQSTQQLFSAGQIILNGAVIDGNYLINTNIIQIDTQINLPNLEFQLSNIDFSNNIFKTKSQSVLLSCLFSLLPQPDHQITAENILVYNNDIIQNDGIENNQYFFSNLIQSNNINIIKLQNINVTDNQYLSLLQSQDLNSLEFDNFECSYSSSYLQKYQDKPSSSCLSLQETKQIKISNLNITQKLAYDSNLIDILNQKVSQSQIEFYNSKFNNILLIQSQQYKQANPLIIKSSFQNDVLIYNCTFQNNTLFGIPNSIAVSSSALQIINVVGTTTFNLIKFLNISSNSDINGVYALSQNILIMKSTFDTTLYKQQEIQSSNQLNQQINIKGGSINMKSQQVEIVDSIFQTSVSHSGGFIYITSYSQNLKINITKSQFKDCFTKLNGGAVFIDTLGSKTQLFISDSSFQNIYQLNYQSSLIFIKEDNIGKNAQINSFIYLNNTNFTNIFGEDITSIFSLTLSQLNIYQSKYQVDIKNSENSILPLDLFSYIYPSTYISSTRSEVNLDEVMITDLQDQYQKSSDHQIFFSGSNSQFTVKNCIIKEIEMDVGGLAFFDKGAIDIYNMTVSNIKFENNYNNINRLLQSTTDNHVLYQITSFEFTNTVITINQSSLANINCYSSCNGGFAMIQQSSVNILESNFTNIKSQSGGAINILNPKQNIQIKQTNFTDNLCQYNGGAIEIVSNQNNVYNVSILENRFLRNIAEQGYGGALYFDSQSTTANDFLNILDNQIMNNKAYIGGGIKYEGIVPQLQNNIITDNTAILYGQNTFSYPTKIKLENIQEIISSKKNIQVFDNKVVINKQRSGESLPNMTFTLRNDQDDIMLFVNPADQQSNYLTIKIDPSTSFYSQYYIRGEPKAHYNPSENSFTFKNIELIGKPLTTVKLMIKSDLIRDSNSSTLTNNYYFEIEAHIQDCQLGEIAYQYSNFKECTVCEKGTYSFDQTSCQKCPNGAECLGGSQIIVDQGYWRIEELDDDILLCEHLEENCIGGSYGNNVCYRGHIGGLCEECDIYGEVWGESYAKSGKYQCTKCSEIANNQYIVALLTFWTLISLIISIKDNMQEQEEMHQKETFDRVRRIVMNKQQIKRQKTTIAIIHQQEDQTSIYIKILTNYFQIISSIATFNLQVPSGIIEFPQSVGQPIQQTMNSLDCALKEMYSSIPIIYLRLIFSLIMPIIYLLIFMIGLFIYYKIIQKSKNFPFYMINTALIFLLIYTQPDLVAQMIALLSCRQIGKEKYILSNVSMKCYTQEFYEWGLGLILPLLFVFIFFFPCILLRQLKNQKKNMQDLEIKRKYGVLYKEYTLKCYYWEFVKMAQKLSIILSLNFYSQDIKTKGILVFTVITFYSISLIIFTPYKSLQINKLDHYSTNVCATSVLLGLFLYNNSYNYLVIISITVIITINALFILLMIRNIILGYTKKLEKPLQDILQKVGSKVKFISNYLQKKKEQDDVKAAKRVIFKQKIQKILLIFKSMTLQQKKQLALDTYAHIIDKNLCMKESQQLDLEKQVSVKENSSFKLDGGEQSNLMLFQVFYEQILLNKKAKKGTTCIMSSQNVIIKYQQSEKSLFSFDKDKPNEEDYQNDVDEKVDLNNINIELKISEFQNKLK